MAIVRKPKNILRFSEPAAWWGSTWREALPTGNGVIGAAVYGGASNDVVMINHGDLWWQGHVGVLQDVSDKIKDVRKKIEDGAPKDAENILSNALITKGYRPLSSYPLPLCDFHIDMKIDKAVKDYARVLNMDNGEITVTFKDGSTRFDRSMFVSRAQNMIVYEITRTGNKAIDVNFSFSAHDKINARTPNTVSKLPDGINVKYEKFFMYFSARSDNGSEFGAVAFINHYCGEQTVDPVNGIMIKGADKVIVTIKPFIESQREKEWKAQKASLTVVKPTYEKLLKEHTPLHSKLFNSAEIDLDASDRDIATDELLRLAFTEGETRSALYEKLWAYGRYLMVVGSSPAGSPCAPYGLWCGDFKAPNSQITADGSLQTIYSHVLEGNMADYMLSVFSYYENVLDDLKKNASRIYGCRGIFIPSVLARGTGVLGSLENKVIHFTGVAGWVAQLFYDYYLFTDDMKFLKTRALPFMKEVALFYENFFKVGVDNLYESCPSYSPDTTPSNFVNGKDKFEIARNSTIDFAIAKELLQNLVDGSVIASANKADIPKWRDMLTRIPPYQQNEDGSIREYLTPQFSDNYLSASTGMFYPLFPGVEVTAANTESLKAFSITAKKKIANSAIDQTSMSLARYANIFARLGDGNTANDILTAIIRNMSMNNMVFASSDWRGMGVGTNDAWANYTIETNMGIASAIQEMFVQSDSKTIRFLPALPDNFPKGEIDGLLTRVGVEIVSLSWDKRKGIVLAKVKSRKATKFNLALPSGTKKFKQVGNEKVDYESGVVSAIELPSNKIISLDIRF